jgi:SNF family Na+-dependent transporter
VSLLLNFAIEYFGEDILAKLLLKNSVFAPVLAGVVGLIPNCASSVIITEMFLSNAISFGSCLSGLLVGSGVGMLILFKVKPETIVKEVESSGQFKRKKVYLFFIKYVAILFLLIILVSSLLDIMGIIKL